MSEPRRTLVITPLPAATPEIGRWLGVLADTRARTLETLEELDPAALDWPVPGGNAVGTLLAHIAAIEMDWLYVEILEQEIPPHVLAYLPEDVRDAEGNLFVVAGLPLSEHLARLAATRAIFVAELQQLSQADFYRPRALPRYDVSPEWVVHHLSHHEAGHRSDILTVMREFSRSG